MGTARGFFSVVRFCPDLDRGEFANVGVILVVPELRSVQVRLSEDNEGPKQRFGRNAYDDVRLSLAKKALEGRVRHEGDTWRTLTDLQNFALKEGNQLVLATPKVILVEDAEAEVEELYQRLVHVSEAPRRKRRPKPDLKVVFESKLKGVPLLKDVPVQIPEYGAWKVAYAYQNGAMNLVQSEGFSLDAQHATAQAHELAVRGHLIHQHPSEPGKSQKLVVVGGFDIEAPEDLKRRIAFVLYEHDTRLVREEQIDDFVEEVRREAHS